MARAVELFWITEYEEDVASDLSVFHRIFDPDELDGPRYFSLAERLAYYAGAVKGVLAAERVRQQRERPQMAVAPGQQVVRVNDAAAAAALTQGHGPGFPTIGYRS